MASPRSFKDARVPIRFDILELPSTLAPGWISREHGMLHALYQYQDRDLSGFVD